MTPAARREQVVVERRDAVDRRLRQPGARGRVADVVVGQLAVAVDRVLEQRERCRRVVSVVAADQLDEVLRQMRSRCCGCRPGYRARAGR
jgi:hypothetical protein